MPHEPCILLEFLGFDRDFIAEFARAQAQLDVTHQEKISFIEQKSWFGDSGDKLEDSKNLIVQMLTSPTPLFNVEVIVTSSATVLI